MQLIAAFQLRREAPSAGSAGSTALWSSRKGEERGFFVCHKRFDLVVTHSKQAGHLVGGAIPQPNPDYLRRWPVQDAEAMKVFVFRHDQQSVVPRVAQIARSGAGARPMSPTWMEPGYRSASAPTRRAARFSSKSSLAGCSGRRDTHNPALALGGERQAGADVLAGELREVREDLVLAHPGRKVG